jgi:5-methylcytosine-specific restriction endonuclease McrA
VVTGEDKEVGSKPSGRRPTTPSISATAAPLVARSTVPTNLAYSEYRKWLRFDFYYSCAYCTMSEAEAQAIRMTIDHYEPRSARRDLEHDYENLMYACDECNLRKGDRCPPPEARAKGYRFFRPDRDIHSEHYDAKGVRLEHKSNTGYYSIEALDLNRSALRRLRELRQRLTSCDRLVAEGILGLKHFEFDQLPTNIRGRAVRAINEANTVANRLAGQIDSLLRDYAASPLLGTAPDLKEATEERAAKLRKLEGLFPGAWRGRGSQAP